MMHQHRGVFFGNTQKAIARALHDSGASDREIADAIPTSVNNIIWWRRENALRDNSLPAAVVPLEQETDEVPAPAPPPRPSRPTRGNLPVKDDPRFVAPEAARVVHFAPAQPTGDNAIEIGSALGGAAYVDLQELLATRLLIQGNSGSGKSHLLRRLLEESTGIVQQIVIDPEGDFVGFAETFGYTVIDAGSVALARLRTLALRAREHRLSVVLNLENLETQGQMEAVAAFLGGLFDSEHWRPAIVAVDEAHLFAPAQNNGEDSEIRRLCQAAMANLMCRGRKRGLAGLLATQRLAKLHKNVAAEASNFLMGRTFLDIDIGRAADLLGLPAKQAEMFRDLQRGEFMGLGPAIARRPLKVSVGPVITTGKATGASGLEPLPALSADDARAIMLAPDEDEDDAAPVALRVVK